MDEHKIRLDEILIREGLVTEKQIGEALTRQKAEGGKLGSQLLYHHYLNESKLIRALEIQFECNGIALLELYIPGQVLDMIPQKVAVARKIIPFAFDPDGNTLKIACEDPSDLDLRSEINFVVPGVKLELFIAAEIALNTIIAKYYLGYNYQTENRLLLDLPHEAGETGALPIDDLLNSIETTEIPYSDAVLLVTDEQDSLKSLEALLRIDHFDVVTTDSADDAIEIIDGRQFHTVFIKDTVSGDYIDLIDRLRKISPCTRVRYYESTASLLLSDDTTDIAEKYLQSNLELFTSLLTAKEQLPHNHGGRVGNYVDKLCRILGLPEKERISIVNTAYLHDLARFYYHTNTEDHRELIKLTVKLLQSIDYSPISIQMLKSMYIDLKGRYRKRLPIEALGGNIITIVDLFCTSVPIEQKLSLDKFDRIKKKFHDLTGKLFLIEVVEAFVQMIQQEILNSSATVKFSQVIIYSDEAGPLYPIEISLRKEGFRPLTETSPERLASLYRRSQPDILILCLHQKANDIIRFVDQLAEKGIDIAHMPTLVLARPDQTSNLTVLLQRGIEDVITIDTNLEMLIAKIKKIQHQILEKKKQSGDFTGNTSGAVGRLADMNLIDLLQAIGPSRKTSRIRVVSGADSKEILDLCLVRGEIKYAKLNNLSGPEAVYAAMAWQDGAWTMEPLKLEEMPPANNDLPNEMIMMEGCRLIDETNHANNPTENN